MLAEITMQHSYLNIIMQKYLTYAPYSIFILWIYIVIQSFKSLKKVKKASGRSYISILNPFSLLSIIGEMNNNKELEIAYQNHKKKSRTLIILWVVSIFSFMVISILVGIVSAYFTT